MIWWIICLTGCRKCLNRGYWFQQNTGVDLEVKVSARNPGDVGNKLALQITKVSTRYKVEVLIDTVLAEDLGYCDLDKVEDTINTSNLLFAEVTGTLLTATLTGTNALIGGTIPDIADSTSYKAALNSALFDGSIDIDYVLTYGCTTAATSSLFAEKCEYVGDRLYCPQLDDVACSSVGDIPGYSALVALYSKSYAPVGWPYVEVFLNDRVLTLPGSVALVGTHVINDIENSVWSAAAGLTRGKVLNCKKILQDTSRPVLELLDNSGVRVNPITNISGIVCFWDQISLLPEGQISRLHNRKMVNYLYRKVRDISYGVMFEPNDYKTWNLWKTGVRAVIENIVSGRGIGGYFRGKLTMR